MNTLLYLIPALGCGDDDIEALRDEVAHLRAERDSTGANADG